MKSKNKYSERNALEILKRVFMKNCNNVVDTIIDKYSFGNTFDRKNLKDNCFNIFLTKVGLTNYVKHIRFEMEYDEELNDYNPWKVDISDLVETIDKIMVYDNLGNLEEDLEEYFEEKFISRIINSLK